MVIRQQLIGSNSPNVVLLWRVVPEGPDSFDTVLVQMRNMVKDSMLYMRRCLTHQIKEFPIDPPSNFHTTSLSDGQCDCTSALLVCAANSCNATRFV